MPRTIRSEKSSRLAVLIPQTFMAVSNTQSRKALARNPIEKKTSSMLEVKLNGSSVMASPVESSRR